MSEVIAISGSRQIPIEYVACDDQTSTASTAVVVGSAIDASAWTSVSYTVSMASFSVFWSVFGANLDDYSDEVAVLSAASVAAGASSSYAVAQAPYRYYRVKIVDNAGHGVATVTGVAKG